MNRPLVSLFCVNLLSLATALPAAAQILPEPAPAVVVAPETATLANEPATAAPEPAQVHHPVLPNPVSHFGGAGQVFFGGTLGGTVGVKVGGNVRDNTVNIPDQNVKNSFSLDIVPAGGFFLSDNFFVRLNAAFHMEGLDPTVTSLVFMPGLGFRIPMGRANAFVPSIGYVLASSNPQELNSASIENGGFLDLPFLFEMGAHLGVTAGPRIQAITAPGNNVVMDYTVNVGLLGWM